jgi:hypothetical protein
MLPAQSVPIHLLARSAEHVNQNFKMNDDLLPEYNFAKLPVVARGEGRERKTLTVQLDPDVATVFPDSGAVNEGLRLLIRLIQQPQINGAAIKGKA